MNHKSYVFLDNNSEPDDFHEDDIDLVAFNTSNDGYGCLLSYEMDYIGIPEGWHEWLAQYPSGYYEIEYESDTEHEYCDGYLEHSYEVATEPLKMTRSRKAQWLFFRRRWIDPVVSFIEDLFSKHWAVSYLYGNVGHRSAPMYLPQALFRRFFRKKKYASWGEGYTIAIERSYW